MNAQPGRFSAVAILIALLLLPLAVIVWKSSYLGFPLTKEVGIVLWLTAAQAAASAGIALVVGIAGGLGLLWAISRVGSRGARCLEAFAILPNAAPVVLLLLAVVKFFPWARGWSGIVFVHALLNSGLVAVAFAQLARLKIAGPAELAYVEGATRSKFLLRGALPILRADLAHLFLFVFALCFASFAVPLAIGGSRATTVEVLIYQKIRISGDWSQALGLALMQMMFIFALSWILRRSVTPGIQGAPRSTPLLHWRWGLGLALLPGFILVAGLVEGAAAGYESLRNTEGAIESLPRLFAGSCLVGFTCGALTVFFLGALAFARPDGWARRFLIGFAAPSSVLTGFALLIAWRDLGLQTYFKIVVGLTLIALPAFYRYQWDALLRGLDNQVAIAYSLGAGPWQIFARIVWPQVARQAFFIGGLAALWAWGDFALSSVIAERTLTLAMAARGMLETYRLAGATFLIWLLILGGLFTFAIFAGAGYVLGSKSET